MRVFARIAAAFCVLWLVLAPRLARADPLSPVIVAGREAEITALAKPYFGTGQELAPGYGLGDVKVGAHAIRFEVKAPSGAKGAVTLEHPSARPPGGERTASFAVALEGADDPAMAAALRALVAAVRANDKGTFWGTAPVAAERPAAGPPAEGPASRYARGKGRWSGIAVPRLLADGVLLGLAALSLTLLHLRRVLRAEPRSVVWSLTALVALGAALRLSISVAAPMNVWPYDRVVPLARAVFDGPVLSWVSAALPVRLYLTDVIFETTLLLAIVTPLAFFAHARFVLRDTRGALFAAALLVVLPNHIRFSHADSEFVQSLATSSLTFVTMYTALRDESRAWRTLCFVLLPVASLATYFVRPENLFFWLVDVGAILLSSGAETPRRRKAMALVVVSAAAAFAFVVHLLGSYQSALQQGLSLRTVSSAISLFFDVRLNTLINPSITPPGLTLLAVFGAVALVRRNERARAFFLTAWLLGFFVVHSFVRPSQPAMQARYHLHLITPLLLLAASGLPELLRWPRRVGLAGVVYLAASPIAHLPFERDTDFNEMHEFTFLRGVRGSIPDGCTVLELSPAADPSGSDVVLSSRLRRMAQRLEHGASRQSFSVVNLGQVRDAKPGSFETLSDEARAVLRNPPSCLMVYTGLTCFSHRPPGTPRAPVCVELAELLALEPIASMTFRSRVYDEVMAGRMESRPNGETYCRQELKPGEEIALGLYRATPRPTR